MQLPNEFTLVARGFKGQLYVAVRCGPIYHIRNSKLSFEESESRLKYGSWTPRDVDTFIQDGTWRIVECPDESGELNCNLEDVL